MDILATYKHFVERQGLWASGDKVLLAVSGGPDSACMVDLTAQCGIEFGISHVNFGLRGEESDGDEAFVRQLAAKYGVEVYVTHADTRRYAAMRGISIEMAARAIRYAEFDRIMDRQGYVVTAVAHHRDDAIETFMLNLMRGSGIRGLTGMRVRNGRIVRPMLCFSRAEIEAFLRDNYLGYRTDSTNLENDFARNRIRNLVMPVIDGISPAARQSITESIGYLGMAKRIYDDSISNAIKEAVAEGGSSVVVSIGGIRRYVEPECLLFEILSRYGFSKVQILEIYRHLDSESGKIFYSNTHRLVKDRTVLIVSRIEDVQSLSGRKPVEIYRKDVDSGAASTRQWRLEFSLLDRDEFAPERDQATVYFDIDKLKFPITVTGWTPGDSFVPFGSHVRKKLSDLFVDNKLSIADKDRVEIMRSGGEILWVMGIRAGNYCRVDANTKQILKISANKS